MIFCRQKANISNFSPFNFEKEGIAKWPELSFKLSAGVDSKLLKKTCPRRQITPAKGFLPLRSLPVV